MQTNCQHLQFTLIWSWALARAHRLDYNKSRLSKTVNLDPMDSHNWISLFLATNIYFKIKHIINPRCLQQHSLMPYHMTSLQSWLWTRNVCFTMCTVMTHNINQSRLKCLLRFQTVTNAMLLIEHIKFSAL